MLLLLRLHAISCFQSDKLLMEQELLVSSASGDLA